MVEHIDALDRVLKIEIYEKEVDLNTKCPYCPSECDRCDKCKYGLKYRYMQLFQHNSMGIDIYIIDSIQGSTEDYVIPRLGGVTKNLRIKPIFRIDNGTDILERCEGQPLVYHEGSEGSYPYFEGHITAGSNITKEPCKIELELTIYDEVTKRWVTLPERIKMEVLPSLLDAPSDDEGDDVYILNHPRCADEFKYSVDTEFYPDDVVSMKGVRKLIDDIRGQLEDTRKAVSMYKPITITIKPGVGRRRFTISDETIEIDDSIGSELKLILKESIVSAFLSTITPPLEEDDNSNKVIRECTCGEPDGICCCCKIDVDENLNQGYISTVSSFSRLQFYIKKIDKNSITLQCFNAEKIIEPVFNEITQEYEDQVTMDVGVINLDALPKIYITINILCIVSA